MGLFFDDATPGSNAGGDATGATRGRPRSVSASGIAPTPPVEAQNDTQTPFPDNGPSGTHEVRL